MHRIVLLFLLVTVSCCACKKKRSTVNKHSVSPPKQLDTLVNITAKINGAIYKTDSVTGYKINYSADSGHFDLLVRATILQPTGQQTITFTLHDYNGVNTYYVSPPYTSATYYLGNQRFYATTGQFIVNSDDPYGIIGTFSFTADTIAVTDGVFNVAQP
ncbi:MAG: hypothetical protein EBZ77_03455 [Chitinophagia bacterium]|nr:hypothetical protein [Chitinophagia bacterium]